MTALDRPDKLPTLVDVARLAGVSPGAASRALNGGVRGAESGSAELKQRVKAAASELGYAPITAAQATKSRRASTLALIVSSIDNIGASLIIAGVMHAAEDRGVSVAVRATKDDADRELALLTQLRGERHRAVIMATSRTTDPEREAHVANHLDVLRRHGARIVVIGDSVFPFPSVTVDTRAAAATLARGLVATGYKRFAIVSGPADQVTSNDRLSGFLAGLDEMGISVPHDLIVHSGFSRDGGFGSVKQLGERIHDLDVIAGMSDAIAVGVIAGLREHGLSVPRDIVVTGFDHMPALSDVIPKFSTVKVPLEDFGEASVSLALDDDADSSHQVVLPLTTIVEGTVID
ncbi:LacI family DNA-binding transcriptional regulator [Arthrobacter sp. SA17]